MCGIVGYVGDGQAAPVLLQGLEKLEYRGYDSAGVAVYDGTSLQVVKAKGRLKILNDMIDGGKSLPGNIGIGHTRWATHGAPSDVNLRWYIMGLSKITSLCASPCTGTAKPLFQRRTPRSWPNCWITITKEIYWKPW